MYCSKCGSQNVNGERFCKNCGSLLENNQPQEVVNNISSQFQQPVNNGMMEQPVNNYQQTTNQQVMYNQPSNSQYQNNNSGLDQNYINKAINPNMKKWAILSIIVPIIAIIWYWFIGLSFYLAIAIAAAGFGFAEKGKMSNKKLATIGKVLNGILCGLAVVMLILQLIATLG